MQLCWYIHLLHLYSHALPRVQGVNPALDLPAFLIYTIFSSNFVPCNEKKNNMLRLAREARVDFQGLHTTPQI